MNRQQLIQATISQGMLSQEVISPSSSAAIESSRRQLLLASLFAAVPFAFSQQAALASQLDPSGTQIKLADTLKWEPAFKGAPPRSTETAALFGRLDQPGPYVVLIKWYPGYMSAPHTYVTDRLSVVLSGVWWVNSGPDFDPHSTVPVPAGSFVRRVAHTPHYDGVIKTGSEPAVIALFGMAPVEFALVDPSKPALREV
jgi:hypothetical protein